MSRKGSLHPRKRSHVSLWIGAPVGNAHENAIFSWFQNVTRSAWQQREPTLVLLPSHSRAYSIKKLLLDRGTSLLGVRFISAADLRGLFNAPGAMRLPLREHLRLLLSIAAEECMKLPADMARREEKMSEADFLAAKSVARAPDHLLRAIDQLGAAGWSFAAAGLPALREVEARFQRQLAACGFELIHTADCRALDQASANAPLFSNILVTGFNGAHWPIWPLLRAGVTAAKEATVLLEHPHDETHELDETWVGTWEEVFGEAKAISPPAREIADSLFSEAEMQGAAAHPANHLFAVGADTTEQAEAIARLCVGFLSEKTCSCVGVVFGRVGSLSRLVGSTLSKLGIPHNDGFGHLLPGLFESAEWRAWLQLQRGPRVNALLQFLGSLRIARNCFPG